jgi:hypothetical protein
VELSEKEETEYKRREETGERWGVVEAQRGGGGDVETA